MRKFFRPLSTILFFIIAFLLISCVRGTDHTEEKKTSTQEITAPAIHEVKNSLSNLALIVVDGRDVVIFDHQKAEVFSTMHFSSSVESTMFSSDGTKVITQTRSDIWIFDLIKKQNVYKANTIGDDKCILSSTASRFACQKNIDVIAIYDLNTGTELGRFSIKANAILANSQFQFTPDESKVIVQSVGQWDHKSYITVYDIQRKSIIATFKDGRNFAVSPDSSKSVVIFWGTGAPVLFDLVNGNIDHQIELGNDQSGYIKFVPDGSKVLFSSFGEIGVYDIEQRKMVGMIPSSSSAPDKQLQFFSPDGSKVIAYDPRSEFEAEIYDLKTMRSVTTFEGKGKVYLSPDWSRLVKWVDKETAQIYDIEKKQVLTTFNEIYSLTVSRDWSRAISLARQVYELNSTLHELVNMKDIATLKFQRKPDYQVHGAYIVPGTSKVVLKETWTNVLPYETKSTVYIYDFETKKLVAKFPKANEVIFPR